KDQDAVHGSASWLGRRLAPESGTPVDCCPFGALVRRDDRRNAHRNAGWGCFFRRRSAREGGCPGPCRPSFRYARQRALCAHDRSAQFRKLGRRQTRFIQIGLRGGMPVTQLIGFSVTVSDLAGAAAFYRDALGLQIGPEQTFRNSAWNRLLGLAPDTTARAVDIAIGRQTVQLVAFDPPGRPYPPERASNDQWFQHFALVSGNI